MTKNRSAKYRTMPLPQQERLQLENSDLKAKVDNLEKRVEKIEKYINEILPDELTQAFMG